MKATRLFYYLRDSRNAPVVTVCLRLTLNGTVVSRGVAICSPLDNPSKKSGRQRAGGRAERARRGRVSSDPIKRLEANHVLFSVKNSCGYFTYKSAYLPVLTSFESQLVKKV